MKLNLWFQQVLSNFIIMNKSKIFTLLILFSLLSGILYGILFDLLNYTIAEEYFTKNLFKEINAPHEFYNRWGTVITGIKDNWWVGILSFIAIGPILVFQKEYILSIKPAIISIGTFIIISLITPLVQPSFDLFIMWYSHVPYESFTIHYNKSVPESERIHNVIGFFFVSRVKDLKYLGLTAGFIISSIMHFFIQSKNRLSVQKNF